MPSRKAKTHKGIKKRFKVSATGKVSHKRCGSSHLMSHKNGKKVRQLRGRSTIKINAVAQKFRRALQSPVEVTHEEGAHAPTPDAGNAAAPETGAAPG